MKMSFNVLVEENGEYHVAHCLETGTVAVARNEFDSISKMCKMLERLVVFALKNNRIQDIFHPAPQDICDRYYSKRECVFHTAQTRLSLLRCLFFKAAPK